MLGRSQRLKDSFKEKGGGLPRLLSAAFRDAYVAMQHRADLHHQMACREATSGSWSKGAAATPDSDPAYAYLEQFVHDFVTCADRLGMLQHVANGLADCAQVNRLHGTR